MTRDDIVEIGRAWIGTRYRRKGRDRSGIDCLGLACVIATSFGIEYQDRQDYFDVPDPDRVILRELRRYLDRVPVDSEFAGTIGVFAEATLPGHVGLFTRKNGVVHLIHAHIRRGVVEDPFDFEPRTRDFRLVDRLAFPGLT